MRESLYIYRESKGKEEGEKVSEIEREREKDTPKER